MSSVNFIATTQPSVSVANVKQTTQQTVATSQSQPSDNSSSSVTKSSLTDQVALSSAGKALAAGESNMTQTRTFAQERLIKSASSDLASAEKIAQGMAETPSGIFWDISGQLGVGNGTGEFVRKLSSTGQIVGDDYVNNFDKVASVIDAQRLAIYNTEKAKGTDPLLILGKMIDFTNSQSQDYLDATGWGWRGSSPPVANATQQSSSVTTGQSNAPQTVASAQSQPTAKTSDSAIPANSSAAFKQGMGEKLAGGNAIKAMIKNDPSNPMWAKGVDSMAQHDFTLGTDVLYDISHTMPGASGNPTIDGILRYSSGEPVTAESQAYVTKQTADYQNQLREIISSEKAKGTSPSDILLKIMDQQGQQPARFRSMMEWPVVSDFTNNQPSATSGGVKA